MFQEMPGLYSDSFIGFLIFKKTKLRLSDSHRHPVWSAEGLPFFPSPSALSFWASRQLPQMQFQLTERATGLAILLVLFSWSGVLVHSPVPLSYVPPQRDNFSSVKWYRPGTEDGAWSGPPSSWRALAVCSQGPAPSLGAGTGQWRQIGGCRCMAGVAHHECAPAGGGQIVGQAFRLVCCTHVVAKSWAGCWYGVWDPVGLRGDSVAGVLYSSRGWRWLPVQFQGCQG